MFRAEYVALGNIASHIYFFLMYAKSSSNYKLGYMALVHMSIHIILVL